MRLLVSQGLLSSAQAATQVSRGPCLDYRPPRAGSLAPIETGCETVRRQLTEPSPSTIIFAGRAPVGAGPRAGGRSSEIGTGSGTMRLEDVKKIGVLGGGVMGGGIGQVLVIAGYQVVIRDLTQEINDKTRNTILQTRFGLKRAVEIGKLESSQYEAAVSNLFFTTEVSGLADCDFIIEAVPENLELKQRVFKELDEIVKPEAVFTSNTSGYVIAEIARDVSAGRKALFAGMRVATPAPAR